MQFLESLVLDFKYALRQLRHRPLITLMAVLTLSLGIGLNAGIFAIVEGIWFRAPVEKDAGSFVQMIPQYSGWFPAADQNQSFTWNDYAALQSQSRSFLEIAAWSGGGGAGNIRLDDDARLTALVLVTCNYFDAYGLGPLRLGRLFLTEECTTPRSAPVAILSEGLWRNRYAADPRVVGRVIQINHHPFTVVGIIRAEVTGSTGDVLWIPITMQPQLYRGDSAFRNSNWPWLKIVGRLKPDFSRAEAQAELSLIENQQDRLIPGRKTKLLLTNGSWFEDPSLRPFAFVMIPIIMGPMALVLLVACTNVAMLQLSNAAARRGNIAVRLALGAGRIRLLRALATEGLIAAVVATAFSVFLAYEIPRLFWTFIAPPGGFSARNPDWLVFTYLACIALLAGCIAGLAPAHESLKVDLIRTLKGQDGSLTTRSRMQNALVLSQIAMSFVLIAAGVMFARQQRSIDSIDPGFETRHVFIVPLDVTMSTYGEKAAAIYQTLEERVPKLPSVQSVSHASLAPFTEPGVIEILLPGQQKGKGRQSSVDYVSTNFFETLGIPIALGRAFRSLDVTPQGTTSVAIVSQAFATAFWNQQDALGKIIEMPDNKQLLVVGVARNTNSEHYGIPDGPRLYVPEGPRSFSGPLMVRFAGEPRTVATEIEKTVRDLDSEQLVVPETLSSMLEQKADRIRPFTQTVLFMAFLAIFLAISGVYGVVAFSVSRRTREFGVRMALGATQSGLLRGVLLQGARQIAFGVSLGLLLALPAAWGWAKIIKGSPFQSGAFDPSLYVIAAVVLFVVSEAAIYIPARRVTRVDPMVALRYE